ncbi:hypothetical protein [Idiomarina aminovorans]|uniref:hypothetical protein n=1 Tax=Idiomarina aminovorans TaxID=2914829 RepID=UPI002002EB42|nr:hypothetical protein [Idiomarina sp. ATCH4]MCK7459577.1 hypothetical protein [Idiomarina sp. ATCH4]
MITDFFDTVSVQALSFLTLIIIFSIAVAAARFGAFKVSSRNWKIKKYIAQFSIPAYIQGLSIMALSLGLIPTSLNCLDKDNIREEVFALGLPVCTGSAWSSAISISWLLMLLWYIGFIYHIAENRVEEESSLEVRVYSWGFEKKQLNVVDTRADFVVSHRIIDVLIFLFPPILITSSSIILAFETSILGIDILKEQQEILKILNSLY